MPYLSGFPHRPESVPTDRVEWKACQVYGFWDCNGGLLSCQCGQDLSRPDVCRCREARYLSVSGDLLSYRRRLFRRFLYQRAFSLLGEHSRRFLPALWALVLRGAERDLVYRAPQSALCCTSDRKQARTAVPAEPPAPALSVYYCRNVLLAFLGKTMCSNASVPVAWRSYSSTTCWGGQGECRAEDRSKSKRAREAPDSPWSSSESRNAFGKQGAERRGGGSRQKMSLQPRVMPGSDRSLWVQARPVLLRVPHRMVECNCSGHVLVAGRWRLTT